MKQAFTILILFAFLPFYSTAQQWAAPGTEWNFTQQLVFHDKIPTTLKVLDELLVDNILVSQLEIDNHPGCSAIGHQVLTYIALDGKVYFKEPSDATFKVLYDFNANVGESWTIPFTQGQQQEFVTYTVENISIVDVEGSPRKQLHCKVTFANQVLWSPEDAYIVEGVGDLHYLFPWQSSTCTEGFIIGLCTYVDDEIGTYRPHPDLECITSLSVNEIAVHDFFQISPNPATDVLNIRVSEPAAYLVPFTIFDMQGRAIHHSQINNNAVSELNVSDWPSGLYIIKSNLAEKLQVGKFMKK